MQTSNLLSHAIPNALSSIQESATQPVKERHSAISRGCRQVSSAVVRQIRDRVGGRFFMPEIIEAAQTHPTEKDYASEEDNVAVYVPSSRGKKAAFRIGSIERISQASKKGGKSKHVPVSQIHIEDMDGKMHCRMYVPAKEPVATEVNGQPAYVQVIKPRPGKSAQALEEVSCADVVCIVTMEYHHEQGVYTMLESDSVGLQAWLDEHLAREQAESAAARGQPAGRGRPAGQEQPTSVGQSAGRGQPASHEQPTSVGQSAGRVHVRNRAPVPSTVGPQSRVQKRVSKKLRRSARLREAPPVQADG